jgi:hypothetical protein
MHTDRLLENLPLTQRIPAEFFRSLFPSVFSVASVFKIRIRVHLRLKTGSFSVFGACPLLLVMEQRRAPSAGKYLFEPETQCLQLVHVEGCALQHFLQLGQGLVHGGRIA